MTYTPQLGNQLHKIILNKNLDGIFVFNQNCEIQVWNEAMEQVSGLKAEYVINKNLFEVTRRSQ